MYLLQGIVLSLLAATSAASPRQDVLPRQAGGAKYSLKQPPLTTPWTDKVGTDPWPEYPRPQLQRPQWQNLNGVWGYQNASGLNAVQSPPFGQQLGQEVLVPSCLESGLSGRVFRLYISWILIDRFLQVSKEYTHSIRGSQIPSRCHQAGRMRRFF